MLTFMTLRQFPANTVRLLPLRACRHAALSFSLNCSSCSSAATFIFADFSLRHLLCEVLPDTQGWLHQKRPRSPRLRRALHLVECSSCHHLKIVKNLKIKDCAFLFHTEAHKLWIWSCCHPHNNIHMAQSHTRLCCSRCDPSALTHWLVGSLRACPIHL